jgi:hypothetical protein
VEDKHGHGVEYWLAPADESPSLAWTWTNTPDIGGGTEAQVLFYSAEEE